MFKLVVNELVRRQSHGAGAQCIIKQRAHLIDRVDQSVVSYWEHGHKAPTVERQLAIAKALGISVRVLFQFPEVA